ncbi:TIGR04283 family arsenosugar biosynthesis glycosyltransferase [uncultured Salinisphaera sp.]|uniref:TIGR04283 family arsenosugar biosynthesis glycosyltransferase n=1 Tax=uncultured Salinisphaera sp. TaxID=359372 RepID=UPI0032B2688E
MTVVVPAIDEAEALGPLLADLAAQRDVVLQVLVADGGSTDRTVALARAGHAEVVFSPPGRGAQMNAAAARATHPWLCFLHADSRLTHPRQLAAAIDALGADDRARLAGHFALSFDRETTGHAFFYRYLEAKSATGRRYTINGDQGLIIATRFFNELGGFDTGLGFLEDQRMAAAIVEAGQWRLCPHRLATSARRFENEGERARYLLMALIMAMYTAGVDRFFERAPSVYARQSQTERLLLGPYIGLLASLWRECGTGASIAVSWRIAGVALAQSWQPFLAIDVALEPVWGRRRHALRLHDRLLRPLLQNRLLQSVLMAAGLAWIFGPLWLWCRLQHK